MKYSLGLDNVNLYTVSKYAFYYGVILLILIDMKHSFHSNYDFAIECVKNVLYINSKCK